MKQIFALIGVGLAVGLFFAVITLIEPQTSDINNSSRDATNAQPAFIQFNRGADQNPTSLPPELDQPLPDISNAVYAAELDAVGQGGATGSANAVPEGWNPLSVGVPRAANPWDHFYFIRPVASNNINAGLLYYPYGTRGSNNSLRVHHGIDISNPIGVEVIAAGDGVILWADEGHFDEKTGEAITTYGNTVVIEHSFGHNGNALFTLYAHLSALLVEAGDTVAAGDVIGLIGDTGQVTGPHVHFEVRYAQNRYRDTRNPDLWIAPYEGTGVVAGHIEVLNLEYADVEVVLTQCDTDWFVSQTSTYAGPIYSDDNWNENFVMPNIPIGCYIAKARFGNLTWEGQVDVQEGTVNWVEMRETQSDFVIPTYAVP